MYGEKDGSFYNENEVKDVMKNIGQLLNLRGHKVSDQISYFTNADMQVYKGKDNR